MRYGLIADIHGNLEAFQAVLGALSKDRIDKHLFIGDVVGYGADPKACIRLVKELAPIALIAGNHEWGALDLLDLEYFNEYAREAIIWTKGVLSKDEIIFLRSFRLVHEDRSMALVHGSLDSPGDFNYVLDASDAYLNMKLMKASLLFTAHSHVPVIFYSDNDNVKWERESKIEIDYNKKYVINVGSVGQPRDGDPRASYAIFDDAEKTVAIRRVEYDIKKAQKKILEAGLPERLAYRLSLGE